MTQVTADKVQETSTSIGASDMVLAGAVAGYRAFSSVCADTNAVPYHIYAVDSNGNPSGDWETGVGTYNSSANSITRTNVTASSNANALVSFSAGTKQVALVLLSSQMYQLNGVPFRQLEALAPGFDYQYFWGFFASAEGWTSSNSSNGTVAWDSSNGKGLLVTDISSTGAFSLRSPTGLSIKGNKYRRIKASVTYVDLGGGIVSARPNMQFTTSGHGFVGTHRKLIDWPAGIQAGDTIVLDWDMETAEGEPDWVTSIITQLSIILSDLTPTGNIIRVNWIAVGTNRPPTGKLLSPDLPILAGNPDPGYLLAQAKQGAMIHPSWLDEFGAVIMAQPFIGDANICTFFPNNASSGAGSQFSGTWTSNGTPTHPAPTATKQGQLRRTKFANVATTQDQYLGPNPGVSFLCFLRGNAAGLGGIFFVARFVIENKPASGWRLFAGLVDDNTNNAAVKSDTFTGNLVGLSHITTDPESGSGAFNLTSRDNATTNRVAISPATALASGQAYAFYMYCPCNTEAVLYKLVLINDGTTVAEGVLTTNLPINTAMMAPHCCASNGTANTAAGDMAIGDANIYCRSIN